MKTLIKHARILEPAAMEDRAADLLIEDGRIADIGLVLSDGEAEIVEAEGLWLFPGLVDIHSHLREPGFEKKETIASGSRAAAAGGITSVVCMANTSPPIDSPTAIEFVLDRAEKTACVRVYPVGALTKGMEGKEMAPIGAMIDAGAVAISDDGRGVMDSYLMLRAMQYAAVFNAPIISHCEEMNLTEGAPINEGRMSTTLGVMGWPREAETIQAGRDMILSLKTGARLHIAHVSAAETVDLIRYYKAKGAPVTAETAPHYLTLTDDATDGFNANAKMNPPLRTAEDQEALFEGLRDGTIDCIATDHAPHTEAEKDQQLAAAPYGIVGFETLLPLLLGPIMERAGFEPLEALALCTYKSARALKLAGGELRVGGPADLVLWDPQAEHVVDSTQFLSKSRNTPYNGWKLKGRVKATYVGGDKVFG
ncbi:MAG: amidohydrolase family protein [bacterium]|nr:amidohydrolase family protein [bacterium]